MKKNLKTTFIACVLFVFVFSINCFAQTNDAIRMIMSAKKYTIIEKYVGTTTGYLYKYTFTKNDKNVDIVWEEEIPNRTIIKGKATITLKEIETLENVFNECIVKIKKNKQKGTEINKYIFKDENTTYEIDDNSSMVCVEDIKAWRERIFTAEKK